MFTSVPAIAPYMAVQAGETNVSLVDESQYCEPCLNRHHQRGKQEYEKRLAYRRYYRCDT
ncbi:hypothetical protein [Photorhabdus aegyptia]|uniref:hypothetical protein n=1 Tax=Photorhabdus aegyptia TaxID=2805098 RepID=UPI0011B0375A|nr:hypothetical protein [Photorhabdus aegyptia]